jgi:hypothetical protein
MASKPRLARRTLAEGSAVRVLREMKIERLPVDPEAIAAHHNILVKPKPDTHDGVSGMLVKAGDAFGIMYATHIPSRGFQRFSIAHELGHYFIEGHPDQVLINGVHHSLAGFISADPFEQEADFFAAALLMPERPFRKELDKSPSGLDSIETLAKACQTSITATAIRYATVGRDGAAVILSSGNIIDCCFLSDGMKKAKGTTWLRKGTPVPPGTLTAKFNAQPENVRTAKRDAGHGLLNDWLGGDKVYRIQEEVIGLGQYGRTLTVLSCQQLSMDVLGDEDDDSFEESLVESWTPRFRR